MTRESTRDRPNTRRPGLRPSSQIDVSGNQRGIEISGISKTFRRRGSSAAVSAIDDVSIDVSPGELVVLLGPSGCGKTTLLRCVAGLERPDSGNISVNGTTMFSSHARIDIPTSRRGLSVIFQGYALWPHMTVYDNVVYPLRREPRSERGSWKTRVMHVLALVGLEGLENEHPGTLSGGQQQRVSLARALVADPGVVLFDEPLSNVDAQVRQQLRREISSMHRRVGFSALYVTHDQEEALSISSRVAVLNAGKVVQFDTPQNVYDRPATRYVAQFVGSANCVPAKFSAGAHGAISADCALGVFTVPGEQLPQHVEPSGEGYVVVRPEDLRLLDGNEESGDGARVFEARVSSVEFHGARALVSLRTGGDVGLSVERPRGSVEVGPGDTVRVSVLRDRVRVVPQ